MASSMLSRVAVLLLCASGVRPVSAASFLHARNDEVEMVSPEFQSVLMKNISDMLGGDQRFYSDSRLTRIENTLRTTFKAMPKNKEGKLEHSAVRYTLHSYFVQRHAWFVRGLSDVGEGVQTTTLGSGTFQDQVEEVIQGIFEQKYGYHGLGLREMAMLVATFENLVHQETKQNVALTFDILAREKVMTAESAREMTVSEVETVLDTYMMSYVLRIDYARLRPGIRALDRVKEHVPLIYPAWNHTQKFLREVLAQHSRHRSFHTRSDVMEIIEQIGDEYGRWQDRECQDLKQRLVALEDKGIGTNGSGRVRIASFYGSAVNDGNWQFVESMEYLKQLGVLDVNDPSIPRVIIPNYINSPTNCVAGSKYYSVCCINECEDLMDGLEHKFAAPSARPAEIAGVIAELGSSTVLAGRTLHPALLARLEEIARHHGGTVPLHGRLFAQWMHHAYPRECPFPHVSGSVRAQRVDEASQEMKKLPTLTLEELQHVLETTRAEETKSSHGGSDEVTEWSHHEEMYVAHVPDPAVESAGLMRSVRPVFYSMLLIATAVMLWQRIAGSDPKAAYRVLHGSKDVFV